MIMDMDNDTIPHWYFIMTWEKGERREWAMWVQYMHNTIGASSFSAILPVRSEQGFIHAETVLNAKPPTKTSDHICRLSLWGNRNLGMDSIFAYSQCACRVCGVVHVRMGSSADQPPREVHMKLLSNATNLEGWSSAALESTWIGWVGY